MRNEHSHIRHGFRTTAAAVLALVSLVFGMIAIAPASAEEAPPLNPTLASDKPEYQPGERVTLLGAGFQPGEAVDVVVVEDNATVTWSTSSDPDPIADDTGSFVWQFNLPTSFIAIYRATATGLTSGATAETTFADPANYVSLDFVAAAPGSYPRPAGGGAFNDRTVGDDKDIVESLEGGDFACNDTVTFLLQIKLDGTQNNPTAARTARFLLDFTLDTTGQTGLALGPVTYTAINYGDVINGAGPDGEDTGMIGDDTDSFATLVDQMAVPSGLPTAPPTVTQPPYFTQGEVNRAIIDVTDLENSEAVILRVDTTVTCKLGTNPTGNLQASIFDADIIAGPDAGNNIPVGNQTVPFKAAGDVVFPGVIIVDKVTDPAADPQLFDFQVSAPGNPDPATFSPPYLETFQLADQTTPWNSGPIDPSYARIGSSDTLIAGTYTVQELSPLPGDWEWDNATCVNGDGVVQAAGTQSMTVDLAENETITCTFYDKLTNPTISVDKTGPAQSKIGDDATYTVTITNTGPVTAYRDTIDDTLAGNLLTFAGVTSNNCGASLAVGAACTIVYDYTVPAGSPDPLLNTVTAVYNGKADLSGVDTSDSDDHSVDLFQPAIALTKTGDALSKIGDKVDYVITLENNSSSDTPDLECTITDPILGVDESITLPPGADHVIEVNDFVIPQGASDPFVNTASAICSPIGFPNVYPAQASWSTELFQPSIDVEKTGPDYSKAGDTATYTVTITNTSSADSPALILDSVVDNPAGDQMTAAETAGCGTLAPGGSCEFSYDYVVPAGAPELLVNTVTVNFNPDGFPNDIGESDSWTTDILHPSFTVAKECKASTEPIPQEGPAVFTITFTNTGDADLVFTPDSEGAAVTVAAGDSHDYEWTVDGPFSGQATVDNNVTGDVTLDPMYELANSYPFSATGSCDVGGRVQLLKLTDGPSSSTPIVDPTKTWTFNVYDGPNGFGTTALASDNTAGDADGILDFGDLNLDPAETYTICEMNVPSGWTVEWKVDTDGDGIPDTVVIPYNPNADDSVPVDLGNRCFDFGTGTSYPVPAGGTLVFKVVNTYADGAPRTPGYWKNWNRCSNGRQAANADRQGGRDEGFTLLEDILNAPGITWDDILSDSLVVPITTCEQAVEILDQRVVTSNGRVGDGKKLASDGARTLAMHLLAAQLNAGNGACTNQDVKDVMLAGETLLDKIDFDGKKTTAYLTTKSADYAKARKLASYLDAYNNSDCDFTTLPPKP